MKLKALNEIKNKHPINSEEKSEKSGGVIPDKENLNTCLNCLLPRCKRNCGLLKGVKK